jgi:Transposase DDE domain
VFISRKGNSSLQRELDSFYKEVTRSDFNIRKVTKGAFTQARSQLNPSAFVEMNGNVCETFYTQAPYWRWKGYRLLAIDGSRLLLPNHKTIIEEFGEYGFGPNADSKRSVAIASMLYDVLNLVTIDAQLAPYSSSERELLYQHLTKVGKGDLLLLDRGYPSIAILYLLSAMGVDFCVRMKEDWWLQVKEFSESGERGRIVQFSLPKKDKGLFDQFPEMAEKDIACRLVCVTLENGDNEILCTSLVDTEKFPYEDFSELYHFRWNEEEGYKLLKARAELECFSGKTALSVKQDFFAKIFSLSYCAILAFPIEEKVRKEYAKNKTKHLQKINRTSALSMFRNISIGLLINKKVEKAIMAFDEIVFKTKEIIRPGRKNERKKRPKKLHYMNYKAL